MNYDLINNKIYMFIHIIKILTGMYKYFIIKRIQSDQQLFTCIYTNAIDDILSQVQGIKI